MWCEGGIPEGDEGGSGVVVGGWWQLVETSVVSQLPVCGQFKMLTSAFFHIRYNFQHGNQIFRTLSSFFFRLNATQKKVGCIRAAVIYTTSPSSCACASSVPNIKCIHFHNFIGDVSFVMASTSVKNCSTAQPVYTLLFMMPKGRKKLTSALLKCSSTALRFPETLPSDSCPLRGGLLATVWFPWAVKQDHVQTTDLTILNDIWCFAIWHVMTPLLGGGGVAGAWPEVQNSVSACSFLSINL